MPRVSKAAIPVEQAVIAPTGVNLGSGVAGRGLQRLGATVSRAGERIEQENKIKALMDAKMRSELDSESRMQASDMRSISDERMKAFMVNTPQSEQWTRAFDMEKKFLVQRINKLDMSDSEREIQIQKTENWAAEQSIKIQAAAIQRKLTDNIDRSAAQYSKAIEDGKDALEIQEAKLEYETRLKEKFDEAEAKSLVEKTEKTAQENIVKQQNEDWSNQIAVSPDISEEFLEQELERRKGGKGLIPEENLPSSDIQALINLAESRKTQLEADTKAAEQEKQRIIENEIHDGINDGTMSVTDIRASELDAPAKRRLENDVDKQNQRDIDSNWPLTDNDVSVQRLNGLLSSMESGAIDTNQMYQQINSAASNGEIKRDTRDSFRSLAKNGGRDAIQIATKTAIEPVRNALITRLTDRQARLAVREQAGNLTPLEQREAGNNAFLLQINKHQLFLVEAEIERVMRLQGKDTVSGQEATAIAASAWESFRRKSLGEKINDFKEFSGQRVPRPETFPSKAWGSADDSEKAEIVELIGQGFTNKQILEALAE